MAANLDRPTRGLELRTVNLPHVVNGKALVDQVTVQVKPGEVLAVLGPSGAGKSSFLRLLNRLDEPTAGTVLLDGQDYRAIAPRQLRRRVGMVMQASFLFPGTVASNVDFGPRQTGGHLGAEQIAGLLESVGLSGYELRDVSTLSGGEAQRVSIARTLANKPEALLLDEPTSALDEAAAREIEQLVLGINSERAMTCVIVTHNRQQALRMATHMMVMTAGRVVAMGSVREALSA
jgi:putative ABC transport system ATP-binding protein